MSIPLTVIEDIIDAFGIAARIESLLPHGVRGRQLTVQWPTHSWGTAGQTCVLKSPGART